MGSLIESIGDVKMKTIDEVKPVIDAAVKGAEIVREDMSKMVSKTRETEFDTLTNNISVQDPVKENMIKESQQRSLENEAEKDTNYELDESFETDEDSYGMP